MSRLFDHGGPLEAARVQSVDQGVAAQLQSRPDGEAEVGEVVRDGRHFLERAPGGDHDARSSREEGLDRFHALARDLRVGIVVVGGQAFALRVPHRRAGTQQSLEVAAVLRGLAG